jgi:peptidoglycan/xylan/chitin deacetylase (PgdA/CDA1 family)
MDWSTKLLKKIFPSIIVKTDSQKIHLTFDDGPHPFSTPIILDILNKYEINATFFLLGKQVYEYPILAKQIKINGHQIGNHSYSHTNLFLKRNNFVYNELHRTEELLISTINEKTNLFRPPYGCVNWNTLNLINSLGMKCIFWSNDSKDYKDSSSEIIKRIMGNVEQGSILLLHDNDLTANKIREYLPALIEILLEQGFKFDIISL